jgi:hypothetical protein
VFKKIVALTVVVVFLSVFSASAFPLQAQEAPGAIEQTGKAGAQGGSSILPIVLIGVGVLAVAAVLIFVVLKTTYDVTGSWVFSFTGPSTEQFQINFTGTKESGTWAFALVPAMTGTYTVSDKALTMTMPGSSLYHGSGTFTSKDAMGGTWVEGSSTWNWTATRGTLASSHNSTQGILGKQISK